MKCMIVLEENIFFLLQRKKIMSFAKNGLRKFLKWCKQVSILKCVDRKKVYCDEEENIIFVISLSYAFKASSFLLWQSFHCHFQSCYLYACQVGHKLNYTYFLLWYASLLIRTKTRIQNYLFFGIVIFNKWKLF